MREADDVEKSRALARFANLRYGDFRTLACDPSLSRNERIGFPDSYREGYGQAIFTDIRAKLPALDAEGKIVLDIGPGCSDLADMMIDLCRRRGHSLCLADCKEMLDQLPDERFVTKVPGLYPDTVDAIARAMSGVDVILCYSVFHYIFVDADVNEFLDKSMALLNPGGSMLIGDIPNVSMRNRFFASEAGKTFHREFRGVDENPELRDSTGQIDDAVLLRLVSRGRAAGVDVYIVPQALGLPMANRREDVLIHKP